MSAHSCRRGTLRRGAVGRAGRITLFAAVWIAIVVGSLLALLGFAYLLTFEPIDAGLLPYAVGTAVAVGALSVFGWLAPENR